MTEQWDRGADERKWWKELKEFADDGEVGGFYAHYARYLEWNNIHSPQRKLLHKMALMAAFQSPDQNEDVEGWCGHCACQSCYDAKRKADHW